MRRLTLDMFHQRGQSGPVPPEHPWWDTLLVELGAGPEFLIPLEEAKLLVVMLGLATAETAKGEEWYVISAITAEPPIQPSDVKPQGFSHLPVAVVIEKINRAAELLGILEDE